MVAQSQLIELTTTKKPLIISVPHSGTRFLKERLGIDKHIHTHINWDTLYERVKNKHIIVPMRSPPDVWRSWCRRRSEDELLEWVPSFFAAWYNLHTLDQLIDLDVICIDKQSDKRISNWKKFGDSDKSHARWKPHKVDLRGLYKLPIVYRNYGSWKV